MEKKVKKTIPFSPKIFCLIITFLQIDFAAKWSAYDLHNIKYSRNNSFLCIENIFSSEINKKEEDKLEMFDEFCRM